VSDVDREWLHSTARQLWRDLDMNCFHAVDEGPCGHCGPMAFEIALLATPGSRPRFTYDHAKLAEVSYPYAFEGRGLEGK